MELHSDTFNPEDFPWQGLTLTPAAAAHIRELAEKQPGMLGVRLSVNRRDVPDLAMFWIPFGSRIKTIWFLKPKAQSFSHRYRRCLLLTEQKWITYRKG